MAIYVTFMPPSAYAGNELTFVLKHDTMMEAMAEDERREIITHNQHFDTACLLSDHKIAAVGILQRLLITTYLDLYQPLRNHGASHFHEARDVSPGHVIALHSELLRCAPSVVVDVGHYALELGIHFFA